MAKFKIILFGTPLKSWAGPITCTSCITNENVLKHELDGGGKTEIVQAQPSHT